jgi:hypothetical protein
MGNQILHMIELPVDLSRTPSHAAISGGQAGSTSQHFSPLRWNRSPSLTFWDGQGRDDTAKRTLMRRSVRLSDRDTEGGVDGPLSSLWSRLRIDLIRRPEHLLQCGTDLPIVGGLRARRASCRLVRSRSAMG